MTDDPRLTAIALGELALSEQDWLDDVDHAELAALEQTVDLLQELYAEPARAKPRTVPSRTVPWRTVPWRTVPWPWLAAAAAVLLALATGLALAPSTPMTAKLWLPAPEYPVEPMPTVAERDDPNAPVQCTGMPDEEARALDEARRERP